MKRRTFALVMLAALASPGVVRAQGAKKVWRIGYLSMATPEADRDWVAALRQGLRDLGYVEGQNTILEQRHAFNQTGRVADLAAELLRREVAVMVVYGDPSIAAVKKLSGVPIVMTVHADPVGTGVVASLARPGGNITGLMDGHADLAPKRLEMLKEVVPSISRVAALFNPSTPHAMRQWNLVQAAGPRLGMTILPIEVRGADEIERAFGLIVRQRSEAVFIIPDPTWSAGQLPRIADLATKNRLPAIGTVREFADHGALVAYGTNFAELWRRSATYVDKILKGAKPGDLPIEHPTKFDFVINLKTAKALGIAVPRALVLRADHLIE
jgi:putative tryptophan/tyrosine transport system substrate-binding protein